MNNDKILDVLSIGDFETLIKSLKDGNDTKLDVNFSNKVAPYVGYFEMLFAKNTELEYLVLKILVQNECFLYDFNGIDDRFADSDDDK